MTNSDHFVLWLDGFMHACNGKPSTKQLKEIGTMHEKAKSRLNPPTVNWNRALGPDKDDPNAVHPLNS